MKRTRILLPSLVALLALGVLAGAGLAAPRSASELSTTDTTAVSTTDGTTTGTTTTGTTTTGTTTTGTTTTGTTTGETTTTVPASTGQTTTQANTPAATTATDTTASVPPPPTAPCDTTQITCGNNASTQVAIVSQNCAAVQQNSVLTIDVQTLEGKPVTDFTINNNTTCLNTLSITQIVQQLCVGCTIVIIPPPPVQSIIQTVIVQAPRPAPERAAYCMPYPIKHGDGTYSTLVTLDVGQPDWDPAYALAVRAKLDPKNGYVCPTPIDQPKIPTFTLTVPLSFVGQSLRLCLQPANPNAQPFCHDVQIDNGATITVPVTQNMAATVVPKVAAPAKSVKKVKAATSAYTSLLGTQKHTKTKKQTTKKRSSNK